MIGLINIVLILIFLVIVPFILGLMYERIFEKDETIMFSRCFAMGLATMLALFQLPAVPMIFIGTSFDALMYVYTALLVLLVMISLFINVKTVSIRVKNGFAKIVEGIKTLDRMHLVICLFALFVIAFQTSLLVFRMHTDTDDSRFIAEALEAIERNTLLRVNPITGEVLSFPVGEMTKELSAPYPFWIAVMSVLTRTQVAVFAHTVLPALLIPLAYSVVYLIGTYLFEENKKIVVYMYIVAVVVMFSFESIYAWGYTLLTIIWQGRSIAAVMMLPLLWYVLMRVYVEDNPPKYIYLPVIVIALANADLSGMGSIMAPIIGAAFAGAILIRDRKIKKAVLTALCVAPAGLYVLFRTGIFISYYYYYLVIS